MSSKDEQRFRGMQMNRIALSQNVLGLALRVGKGFEGTDQGEEPYRVIENIPIFHINCNVFEREFDSINRKTMQKFGEFYHPYLMMGMPDSPGTIKVYVDFRYDDRYVLLVSAQLDQWCSGPSFPAWSIVTWTPKVKGDSKMRAGNRLFKGMILSMDGVKEDQWTTNNFESDWESDWSPSERCLEVMRAVRG